MLRPGEAHVTGEPFECAPCDTGFQPVLSTYKICGSSSILIPKLILPNTNKSLSFHLKPRQRSSFNRRHICSKRKGRLHRRPIRRHKSSLIGHLSIRLNLQSYLRERTVFKNRHAKLGDFLNLRSTASTAVGKHIVPANDEHVIDAAKNTPLQPGKATSTTAWAAQSVRTWSPVR